MLEDVADREKFGSPKILVISSKFIVISALHDCPQFGKKSELEFIGALLAQLVGAEPIFSTHIPDISWLNDPALLNILSISVTLDVSHSDISWSKSSFPANISYMFSTFETHQSPISWLKLSAFLNIWNISVTLQTSQSPISWLKSPANSNISFIFVTLDTSQSPISWLKS